MSSPFIQKDGRDYFTENFGDSDLTLYWDLRNDLKPRNIKNMNVFYNDVDIPDAINNGWVKHNVISSEVSSNSTRILLNSSFINKQILYYFQVSYIESDSLTIIDYTSQSFQTIERCIVSPTTPLILNNYDGRSTLANEENVYYLNISDYTPDFEKIYINMLRKETDPSGQLVLTNLNILPQLPLLNSDQSLNQFEFPSPPDRSIFVRVDNVQMDLIHEVSVFYKSGYLSSPLSLSRTFVTTKKLLLSDLAGKSPRILNSSNIMNFDGNRDGKIRFITNFDNTNKEKSPESSLELLLFLIQKEVSGSYIIPPETPIIFKRLDILSLLYDRNSSDLSLDEYVRKQDFGEISATIEIDGDNLENITNEKLEYNKKYKLVGATKTDGLTYTILDPKYSTREFCIQKIPLKPTIDNCNLSQDKVLGVSLNVNWTNGEMFNNDVNMYSLKITYLNEGIETELEGLTPNISVANSDAVYSNTANFTSGREYKVYVRTHVLNLNVNGTLLVSEWSTPVTFTYYRKSEFTSLNLLVDKNIENVNSKAMLSWNIANTSGLSIEKFILYKDVVGDADSNFSAFPELPGTTFEYPDGQLTNGTSYNYKVELSLTAKEFSNIPILRRETIISSEITFRPWTLPEKPVINDCYLSQYNSNSPPVVNVIPPLNVNWTNGSMYNSDVHSYSLKITYLNEDTETELVGLTPNISLANSNAIYSNTEIFTSGRYKFYVKTNVLDLNNAVDQGTGTTLVLSSDWSTPVQFTYYRVSEFTSLNLSIDKNKSNVDSKAMLSWNKPNSSNIDLYRFEIYRAINSPGMIKLPFNLNNATFSYVDTGLTNGDTYSYLVKTFIEVTEFRDSVAIFTKNEWFESLPVSIIPWKLPDAPALSLSNWDNNFGNRYVDLRLLAVDNYMKNYINGYNVRYKVNSSQDYEIKQFNYVSIYDYNVRIGDIVNEQLYDFNANVMYSDPNVSGELHPTSYSEPNLQVTPTAIKDYYAVTNLVFSEIGDEKVKVTWVKPVLVDENKNNNLNPSIVGDNRKFKRYEINVFEKNLSNDFVLVYTLNDDRSVLSLNNSNTLTYTFDKKLNSNNQKVLVNGKTYKFSVSACYDSESSTVVQTVKNETSSNVEIFPYMIYSATDLRYTSKNYDTGDVNFSYLYSTNNNNNVNYLAHSEIWVNDVKRYIISKNNTIVNSDTPKVLRRDVFLPADGGLVDERPHKVVVRLVFDNPNKTIVGEPSTTHVDSLPFYVRSYKRPDNLSLTGSNVTNSSVQLNWIFPSTSFEYSIFTYNLRRKTPSMIDFIVTDDIPRLSRSFNLTGLDNEETYQIGISSVFTDLDTNEPVDEMFDPINVTIRTHLPSPTDLTFQEYVASDKTISLKFNTPSTIIGLNTSNYKIHYKPVESQSSFAELLLSELNSSGKFVNGFYLITGLTNGTQYELYYSAQLDNSVNVEEGQDTILTTRSVSKFLTPLKEADPVDDLRVVSYDAGLTIDLSWTSPELNGSIFKEYKLYKKLRGTSDWIFVTATNASSHTFADNLTKFNDVYEFYVIVITRDVNTNELLDSSESNVVSHHFFEAPKQPNVISAVFITTTISSVVSYSVNLDINYTISNGLYNPRFVVKLNGIQHSTHAPSVNAEGKYIISLTNLRSDTLYDVEVGVNGINPNNSVTLPTEFSVSKQFEYFDNPILQDSSVIVTGQDQSLLVKINEYNNALNLMNTDFQHYVVNVYDAENDLIYTNNIVLESVNDLIIYNLINGVSYKVTVTPVGQSPIPGSIVTLDGNLVERSGNTPTPVTQDSQLVPAITIINSEISNNRLTFDVDTKGQSLLGWYLFFQFRNLDHPQYPRYNQFLYRSPPNSIYSGSNGRVKIVIDVLKDLNVPNKNNLSDIVYSFVAYNQHGRSEFNMPNDVYNKILGTGNYVMYTNAGNLSNGYIHLS